MKLFSTKMHGVIDYLSVGTLLTLPRAMGWSEQITRSLTTAALGTLAYSLLTNYELGLVKVLPMTGHLALDGVSGLTMLGAPLLYPDEDSDATWTIAGFGVFELAVTLLSETEPE